MKAFREEPSDSRLSRLFQRILSFVLIAVFISIFIHYAIEFLSVIGTLNRNKVGVEFQQTVNEAHAAWLHKRENTITLRKLNTQMEKGDSITFRMNAVGWPVAVADSELEPCRALYTHLQSERWDREMSSQVMELDEGERGCQFGFAGRPWFFYSFSNGSLRFANE